MDSNDTSPNSVEGSLHQIQKKLRQLNALLQERMAERSSFTELLQEITLAANEASTVEAVLQFTVNRICVYTGWPLGHVYLVEEDESDQLVPTTIWYRDNPTQFQTFSQLTERTTFSYGMGLPGKVLALGQPLWITDVTQDPEFLRAKSGQDINLKAAFAFPVMVGANVVGVLEFFSPHIMEPDEPLLAMMGLIGSQLGQMIERKRLEKSMRTLNRELEERVIERTSQLKISNRNLKKEVSERKRAERNLNIRAAQQLVVAQLGQRALRESDLMVLMDEAVAQVVDTLAVDYSKILELLPSEDMFVMRAGAGWPAGIVGQALVEAGPKSQAGYTVLADQAVIVTNLKKETRFNGMALLHNYGVVSGMTVVIPGREKPYGILGAHATRPVTFTPDDANFLQAVANVLAAAIERKHAEEALRYSRDQLEERVIERTAELQAANIKLQKEVAERKHAEVHIRHREQQLAEAQEIAQLGSWEWDIPANKISWSDEMYRIYGLKAQEVEVTFEEFLDYVHPNDRNRVREIIERAYDSGQPFDFDHRIIRPDGEIRILHSRGKVEANRQGQPVKMFGTGQDITGQREREAEVAELQRRLMEGREMERLILAQELHDGPLQDLNTVFLHVGKLEPAVSGDETGLSRMAVVQATLQKVMQTLRAICGELRPPALAPFGLEKAIRSDAETFQKQHPALELELDLTADEQTLPEQTRLALFRVYQQAMANIDQHAQARHVTIRFQLDAAQILLEIEDDGEGFVLPQRYIELVRQGHYGLVGAIERVEAIGGSLNIVTAPGEGTRLHVVVPRANEPEA